MTYGFKFNNINGELVVGDSNVKPWYFTGSVTGTSNFFGQNYKNVDVTANAFDFSMFNRESSNIQQPSSYVDNPTYTGDLWRIYELRYIAPNVTDCFFAYTLPRSNDTGIWYFTQDVGINQPGTSTAGAGPIHLLNNPKTDTLPYPGTGETYVSIFAMVPDRFNLTDAQLRAAVPKVYFFSNKEISNNILSTGYGLQVFDSTAKCMYDSGKLHIQLKDFSFQDWTVPPPPAASAWNGSDIRSFSVNTTNPPSNTAFVIPATAQYYYREYPSSEFGTLGAFDVHRVVVQRVDSGTDTGNVSTIRTRTVKMTSQATQALQLGNTLSGVTPGTWWNYGTNSYSSWVGQQYKMDIMALDTVPLERGYTGTTFPSTFVVTVNKTTVLEGNSDTSSNQVVFTLTTSRVDTGSQFGYTITGTNITLDDISFVKRNNEMVLPKSLTGFFTVNNNIGTITLTINEDYVAEGSETLTLTLNNGLSSASVSLTEDTAYSLSFITTPDTSTGGVPGFNEDIGGNNQAVVFQLKTKNIAAGTYIPYSILNISTDADDFTQATSGDFIIEARPLANAQADGFNGQDSTAIVLRRDLKTEGTETARIRLTNMPSVFLNFDIIDNSLTPLPVWDIFNPSSQNSGAVYLNEGTEYVWVITATNLPSGTVVYPRIIPNTAEFADLNLSPWYTNGSYNGVALSAGGTAVFRMTPVADELLEGIQNFTIGLDYPLGTRVHTYPGTVFINDTSKPPEEYTMNVSSQFTTEGQVVRITFISSLDYAHPVFWTWEGVDLGSPYAALSLADISSMRYFDPETNISGGSTYTQITKSDRGTFSFPTSGLKTSNLQYALEFTINNDGVTEPAEYAQVYLRPEGGYTGSIKAAQGFFVQDPVATYSISPNVTSINEGGTLIWNITTTNVPNGTVLYWLDLGTNTNADYNDNVYGGSVTINNNTGTVTRVVKADAGPYEGPETAKLALYNNSSYSTLLAQYGSTVTINDTSTNISESLTISPTSVVFPNPVTVSITGGVPNTIVRFSLDNTSYAGSVTLDANGNYTNPNAGPGETVGTHTLYVKFDATNNTRQASWTVTPAASTYSFSRNISIANEGATITYNATTTNVANGTTLYWRNLGSTTSSDFTSSINQGSFTINNNTGSFTLTLKNDQLTEGEETVYVFFYSDSGYATMIGYTGQTTVNDTSTTPVSYPAAGTLLSQYCGTGANIYTRYGNYADGSGGSYVQVIETNSSYCGYVAPATAPLVTSVVATNSVYYPGEVVEAIINFSGPITANTYLNVRLTAGVYGTFYVPNGSVSGGVSPSYGYGGAGEVVELLVGATSAYYTGPQNPGQYNVTGVRVSAKTVTAASGGSDRQAYIQSSSFRLETGIPP